MLKEDDKEQNYQPFAITTCKDSLSTLDLRFSFLSRSIV